MSGAKPFAKEIGTITGIALVLLVGYLAAVTGFVGGNFDPQPLLIGSILFIVSLPILAREAARDNDRRLFWLLVAALALKLLAALARHYMSFHLYGGAADAVGYQNAGAEIAAQFRSGDFHLELQSLQGTQFVNLLTGVVYTVIGSGSRVTGYVVFSWFAFWGVFLAFRGFRIAVPEGRMQGYAHLVFLFPSLVFWPSSLGKEAWMVFAIGVTMFGAANIFIDRAWRGLALTGLGLLGCAVVRPHVAGMLAVAVAGAYVIMRPRRGRPARARALRVLGIAVVAALAVVLVLKTQEFLGRSDLFSASGIVSELEEVSQRSDSGGSEFEPIVVRSPTQVPAAVVTALFRPFPTEANNALAFMAALESVFLAILVVARWRWIWAAVRSIRRQPYVGMAIAYVAMFSIAFASFPNFGLLVRERVQVLPLLFVLLSVAPRDRTPASETPERKAVSRARGPRSAGIR